MIFKIL